MTSVQRMYVLAHFCCTNEQDNCFHMLLQKTQTPTHEAEAKVCRPSLCCHFCIAHKACLPRNYWNNTKNFLMNEVSLFQFVYTLEPSTRILNRIERTDVRINVSSVCPCKQPARKKRYKRLRVLWIKK